MASIAACFNVYNDAPALRGALETASRFFDNIFVVHSGPGGIPSNDGTMELLKEFGIDPKMDDMQKGFGVIRTRLIHECGCDWAFLLDCDERFHPMLPIMHCTGTDGWSAGTPMWNHLELEIRDDVCNQGRLLRALTNNPEYKAIRSIRRHWFDLGMRRPTQNWFRIPDHQLRIIKNEPEISYRSDTPMHERIFDVRTGGEPHFAHQDVYSGIFHDHFHCAFRKAYPGHKEENERRYARLQAGQPMLE